MGDSSFKLPPGVTVEDLLRLKRSEHPAPEFWTEFERTLRQRQLAALVERRSWWRTWLVAHGRLARWGVPVATTAVLGLAMVSSRTYFQASGGPARIAPEIASIQKMPAVRLPAARREADESRASFPAIAREPRTEEVASSVPQKTAAVVAAAAANTAPSAEAPISWLGDVLDEPDARTAVIPLVRPVAADLAPMMPAESDLMEAVVRPLGFEERAMPVARSPRRAEMLPTAVAVTEPRRARLLASLGSLGVYSPGPSAPEHARRSVLRYLTEDGWDRSLSRLEAEGDKLSIKF